MAKRLPFTEHSIRRLIRGIESAGKFVVGARPDGTLIIGEEPLDTTTFAHVKGTGIVDPIEAARASSWDDFKDAPASVWDDKRTRQPVAPKQRKDRREHASPDSDPPAAAYERFRNGEITFDQLPPGRYPNGMRVYADGEWEAIVRRQPLRKLERVALEAYFLAKGTIGYVKGAGPGTNDRLEIRGFVAVVQVREDGRAPYYGITPTGEAEWLRLAGGARRESTES